MALFCSFYNLKYKLGMYYPENKLDVYFRGENNAGLPPVPFHLHSPLRTLKATFSYCAYY